MIRRKLINKSSAVIFAVTLLFTAVFSMSVCANAATTYTPRTTAPSYSSSYYYSNQNIFYANGYGMPNCTAYAYGRAYEILGTKPNLSKWSAEYWYGDNIEAGAYSYGKTPKLGAIACWRYNGGGGHVAVVEKIENGTITFSNSAWGGSNFYLTHASVSDPTAGGQSWWNFQGYIYILDNAEPEPAQTTSIGIYKTNVSSSLNMRNGAGTGYSIVTSVPNNVTLTVTKVSASGGYTWGYTTYKGSSGWISLDYCTFVSDIPADFDAHLATPKITSSQNTDKGIKLSWSAIDGASQYRVFYKGSNGWKAMGDTDQTSYVDEDVRSGGSYTYTVRCLSADGSRFTSDYDSTGFKASFIAMPVLKSYENTADGVKLSWDKVPGAYRYRVFYLGSKGWNRLGDTDGTTLTDTIVRSGSTYTYTIRCYGADGNYTSTFDGSGFSATYIDVPHISKSENTTSGVKLSWDKVDGAAKYRVFYKAYNGSWKSMGDTATDSFTDTVVTSGNSYTYTVRCLSDDSSSFTSAYDTNGFNATFVDTPSVTKTENVSNGVKITWGSVRGASKYRVFYKTSSGWNRLGDSDTTSIIDNIVTSGKTYTYTVRCLDKNGNYISAFNSNGWKQTYVEMPKISNLTNTPDGIKIEWKHVNGAAKYRVFYLGSKGWTRLGDTDTTTIVDSIVYPRRTYTYTVRALDSNGNYISTYDSAGKSITYLLSLF